MTYEQAEETVRFLAGRLPGAPEVGVVLGSGMAALADEVESPIIIDYAEIPNWPRSTVAGQPGRLVWGKLGPKPVAALAGRVHLYEGLSARAAAFPTRVLGRLGVRTLILTNAAGAVREDFRPGQLVLIADHVNLLGVNPLFGENEDRWGPRFVDLSEVYPARLRELARRCARELEIELAEGVYAALPGPNYETPAEVRYLRTIGADLVGMSTVPEAIAAAQMGVPVLGISCVANTAAGVGRARISHDEVLAAGREARPTLAALLRGVIERL